MRRFTCPVVAVLLLASVPAPAQPRPEPDPGEVGRLVAVLAKARAFEDNDTWAAAIRRLEEIGAPAVPALAAELERNETNGGQAAIARAMRLIGDPRAVPSLVHALARCRVRVSDYGIHVPDPELHLYMTRTSLSPRSEVHGTASFNRPVREITAALETLTGHTEGDAHFRMYDANGKWPQKQGPEHTEREMQMIRTVADRWLGWWEKNREALLDPQQLEWVRANSPPPHGAPPRGDMVLHLRTVTAEDAKPAGDVALEVWVDRLRYLGSTKADGTVELQLLKRFKRIAVIARKDGRVPTMLAWAEGESVPERRELRLPRATSLGGTVIDPAGQPVEGARVFLLAPQPLGDHAWADLLDVPAPTDAQGRWRLDGVPEELSAFALRVGHPRVVAEGFDASPKVDLAELRAGKAKLTVQPMFRVRGRVLDAGGKPVAGARVSGQGKEAWRDQYADLATDKEGRFEWDAVRPGELKVSAQSPAHGPVTVQFGVAADVADLDLRLGPGRQVRGRVVDRDGRPVPRARVVLASWAGHKMTDWSALTDADGRFAWDHAPQETMQLGVYRTGYDVAYAASQPPADKARAEELTVKLQPVLRVEGVVVDAASGKPIEKFVAMPGLMHGDPPAPFAHRNLQREFVDPRGRFTWTFSMTHDPSQRARRAEPQLLRVEAPGYLAAVSRPLEPDEGTQRIEFRLTRAPAVAGTALSPDGEPLAGADVLLATPSQMMSVSNGRHSDYDKGDKRNVATVADAAGRFELPPQDEPFVLVVLHDRGHTQVTSEQFAKASAVRVAPWGRVEGVMFIDDKPADTKGVQLWITHRLRDEPGEPRVQYGFYGNTDERGRFAFDRVPAGSYRVGSQVPLSSVMFTSSPGVPLELKPGETARVTLGGTGTRPVAGRLVAPGVDAKVDWSKTKVIVRPSARGRGGDVPPPPDAGEAKEATVSADGSFRFGAVRAGAWDLEADVTLPPTEPAGAGDTPRERVGRLSSQFEVPGGDDAKALELGALEMAVSARLAVGQQAPPFTARTVDGKPVSLADFKGKYVLLDFWATWCGPCLGETPHLKATYAAHGKDPRFAMLGLSLDPAPAAPKAYAKEHDLPWTQGFLGDWSRTDVPASYGVEGIPSIWLIGPDGRVVARDLRGERIQKAVAEALANAAG